MPRRGWAIEAGGRIRLGDQLYISFQRTRRVAPADAPMPPPSYGIAPVAPRDSEQADLIVPVRDDEAIWIGLSAVYDDLPCAVRVIVLDPIGVDATTGDRPSDALSDRPQNYVVVPPQHAVTGVAAGEGVARQFVRTSPSDHAAPCRRMRLVARAAARPFPTRTPDLPPILHHPDDGDPSAAIGNRGLVLQRIIEDPYGLDTWRQASPMAVTIEWVAPDTYASLTGEAAPGPISEEMRYRGWRLP